EKAAHHEAAHALCARIGRIQAVIRPVVAEQSFRRHHAAALALVAGADPEISAVACDMGNARLQQSLGTADFHLARLLVVAADTPDAGEALADVEADSEVHVPALLHARGDVLLYALRRLSDDGLDLFGRRQRYLRQLNLAALGFPVAASRQAKLAVHHFPARREFEHGRISRGVAKSLPEQDAVARRRGRHAGDGRVVPVAVAGPRSLDAAAEQDQPR